MKKILLLFFFISCNVFAFEQEWQHGQYSSVKLIGSNNFLALQIKPNANAKIYSYDVAEIGRAPIIKISSDNIVDYKLYYPNSEKEKTHDYNVHYYGSEEVIPIEFAVIDKNNQTTITIDTEFTVCLDACSIERYNFYINVTDLDEDKKNQKIITDAIQKSAFKVGYIVEKNHINTIVSDHNIFTILLYAFIGGVILNFMPCVLPIISLKMLNLQKISAHHNSNISIVFMMLGIVFSMLCFALFIIIFQLSGEYIGFGFHFQNQEFLLTTYLLLLLIAIYVSGNYAINLPRFLTNIGANRTLSFTKYFDSFAIGILTTILATPCTAPYLCIATGYAVTASKVEIFAIFLFISLGLCLPYMIFLCYPKILNFMPKSGKWLDNFKKILALMIFISAIWILYVIKQKTNLQIALILFLLGLLIKFVIEVRSKIFDIKFVRVFTIFILCLCVYVLPFKLKQQADFVEEVADGFWQEFDENKISKYLNENKKILVNFTASWCITCEVNKFLVLNNPNIIKLMQDQNLIGMRADLSDVTPKNILRFMQSFHRNDIPFTVFFSSKHKNGLVLPVILSPDLFIKQIEILR